MQNKPTKEAGVRRAAHPCSDRAWTERHGCGHGPEARPLGSMHGDDDGGGRGGGGEAPRATLQHARRRDDDETQKNILGQVGTSCEVPVRPSGVGVSRAPRPHSQSNDLYGSTASPVSHPQTAKIAILSLDRKLCPSFRSAEDARCGGRTRGRRVSHA